MNEIINEINKIAKEMFGRRMTKKEKELLKVLRRKVRNKEITVKEAQEIWDKKVLKKEVDKNE